MVAYAPRPSRFPYVRSRSGAIDGSPYCILFHDWMDVCRYYLSSVFPARSLSSVSHSDAVSFSAIFVWCAFQTGNALQVHPLFLAHARRLLTVKFFDFRLALPCARSPLPGSSWAPRHLLPYRGQAGPHSSDDLSLRCLYRSHRRPDRREDPPLVIPWHDDPSALYDGRRDLALEERGRQRRLDS